MQFISNLFRYLWRGLDGLRKVLHLFFLLVIVVVIIAAAAPSTPVVPSKAALVLNPRGALVEQLSGDPLERAFAAATGEDRAETALRDLIDALGEAKKDDRIRAVVLDLEQMSGGGLAKLAEVAAALDDFRKSGKPIIALGRAYDQSQYYLAAHADEIYLDPQGSILIDGFGYYRMFLKNVIEKLAVNVHVFRAGKYKSFTDQFSRSDMGPAEREESLVWLGSLWTQYQATVTKARKIDAMALSQYIEEMVPTLRAAQGDLAKVALERKLVTGIKTRAEVEEKVKALVGSDDDDHSFNGVDVASYLAARGPGARAGKKSANKIGVIIAAGEIVDGRQPPGTVGSDSTVDLLRQARHDKDIKAVVLRIDSPGGSMQASETLRREIDTLKSAGKPVIASMSSIAASGGYYIAMDADEIWASPSTITGSIGVFAVVPTFEGSLNKLGINVDGVGTTSLSGSLRIDRDLSPQVSEILQLGVDHAYSVFIGHVAAARRKSVDAINDIAQGRVWSGSDAKERGLVDKLGSYQDALNAAATRAKLGKDYEVEYVETPLGWRALFAREVQAMAARIVSVLAPRDVLSQPVRKLIVPMESELKQLLRMAADPREIYYHCACSAP
jgi:protease-4